LHLFDAGCFFFGEFRAARLGAIGKQSASNRRAVGRGGEARLEDTAGSGDPHRREEVEKGLLKAKSLSQFQDKMKSRSTAPYRLPRMIKSGIEWL